MLSARNAGAGEAPNVTAPARCCSISRVSPAGLNFPVNPPLWDEGVEAVCVPQASVDRQIRAFEARMTRNLDRSAASGEPCSWLMLTQRQGGLLWRVFQFVAYQRARGPGEDHLIEPAINSRSSSSRNRLRTDTTRNIRRRSHVRRDRTRGRTADNTRHW